MLCNAIIVEYNNGVDLKLCYNKSRINNLTCNKHGSGSRLRCSVCNTTFIIGKNLLVNMYVCPRCDPSSIVFEYNNFVIGCNEFK